MKMFLALKVVCLLIVVSLYVSIATANVENKRNRQMSAVDDAALYDTLVQLTKSEFDVPVKQRSAQQKASCVRFWRNKSKLSIQNVNGKEK